MYRTGRPRARWLIVALLASAAAALWEIGADAGRIRITVRFLSGQIVSLGSASASDNYVLIAYLAEVMALAAAFVLFLGWQRRPRSRASPVRPLIAVWWQLWVLANIFGRLVELTYRATSSLTDIRNVTLLDLADSVALVVSLLVMVRLVQRVERRATPVIAAEQRQASKGPASTEPGVEPTPVASRRGRSAVFGSGIGALLVAPLALAFFVSNGTTKVNRPSNTPPAAQTAAWQASNAAAATCPDAMFQPSGVLKAGLTSTCADLTLGASLFSADCTKGAIPAALSPEVFDAGGQTSTLGAVQSAPGGCDLITTSTSVTAAVLAGDVNGPTNEPGSVVVVADFLAADNPAGLNTIGVRVTSGDEFDVAVQSGGDYAVIQSTGGGKPEALLQGHFTSGAKGVPDLSKEVRVVVYVKGSTAAAYVDGLLIGTGPTAVPDATGGCGFSLSTDDAAKPVVARLLHLEIFAAG